jgi:hypothetical protein
VSESVPNFSNNKCDSNGGSSRNSVESDHLDQLFSADSSIAEFSLTEVYNILHPNSPLLKESPDSEVFADSIMPSFRNNKATKPDNLTRSVSMVEEKKPGLPHSFSDTQLLLKAIPEHGQVR